MKNQTKKVMRMLRSPQGTFSSKASHLVVEEMKLQRYPNAESFAELLRKSDERNDEFLAVSSKNIRQVNNRDNGLTQSRQVAEERSCF